MGKFKIALSSLIVAGFLSVGVSTIANASPGGCMSGIASDNRGYGNCSSGTGQYRVGIPCIAVFGFSAYGPWSNVNQASSVGCPWPSTLWTSIPGGPHAWIEVRN